MRAVNLFPIPVAVLICSSWLWIALAVDPHQTRPAEGPVVKRFSLPVPLPAGVSHQGVFDGEDPAESSHDLITAYELPQLLAIEAKRQSSIYGEGAWHTLLFRESGRYPAPGERPPDPGCYITHPYNFRRPDVQRAKSARERGGNDASESAVATSLQWIVSRQMLDGGWSFDHNHNVASCVPDCLNPGTLDARNGATALALLPLLGAGQTHKEGSYKRHVYAGLAYLIKNMRVADNAGSWEDNGRLLSHAWAALAMCEAYAMTHDRDLLAPAQLAINYLVAQQDQQTGGWDSSDSRQDTLLTAWCVLALRSGHLAYLQTPKKTVLGAKKLLDARATSDGAFFRQYKNGKSDRQSTAAALLAQMYLGWKQGHPPLVRAVAAISKAGPSEDDARYNFLAANVMIHAAGEDWNQWNAALRDSLVQSQATEGPAKGSWYFDGADGARTGGRLYHTALSALTLEVYYRHMPIYRRAE